LAKAELAACWAAVDLPAAQDLIETIETPRLQSQALVMVARALAPVSPDKALALAQEVPAGPQRAYLIAGAAAAMPEGFGSTAQALANAALQMLGDATGEAADRTRADIAAALAWNDAERAISVADNIREIAEKNKALCIVGDRLAKTEPRRALAILSAVDDPMLTEPVLTRLAGILAATDVEEALATSRMILSGRLRVQALVAIGVALRARQGGG